MAADKKPQEVVRSLAAHPRWPDFMRLLEKREARHVARLIGEQSGDSAVFRRQGQALESRELLEELRKLALPPEHEEQQRKGQVPLG
jgi:hypothetical protein